MRVLFLIILSLMFNSSSWAYLTAGKIAVTATSSSSGVPSTSQDSDITDTKGSSVSVGVPVAVTGNVNITGNYQVNGTPISATSNWNQSGSTINYTAGNVGIGSTNPGQALDVQGTIRATGYINSMQLVSVATPSAVANFTISGLAPGNRYQLILNLTQNTTAGYKTIQFNADSGSNYNYHTSLQYSSTVAYGDVTSSGTYILLMDTSSDTDQAGGTVEYTINFQTIPGSNTTVRLWGFGTPNLGSSIPTANLNVAGTYAGGSNLTSIKISTSAGTMTGTAALYQLN